MFFRQACAKLDDAASNSAAGEQKFIGLIEMGMVVDTTIPVSIIAVNFRNCQSGKCLRRAYASAYHSRVRCGSVSKPLLLVAMPTGGDCSDRLACNAEAQA